LCRDRNDGRVDDLALACHETRRINLGQCLGKEFFDQLQFP
jgi:hypothetical protein